MWASSLAGGAKEEEEEEEEEEEGAEERREGKEGRSRWAPEHEREQSIV